VFFRNVRSFVTVSFFFLGGDDKIFQQIVDGIAISLQRQPALVYCSEVPFFFSERKPFNEALRDLLKYSPLEVQHSSEQCFGGTGTVALTPTRPFCQ
jgi:hypothetical protein